MYCAVFRQVGVKGAKFPSAEDFIVQLRGAEILDTAEKMLLQDGRISIQKHSKKWSVYLRTNLTHEMVETHTTWLHESI